MLNPRRKFITNVAKVGTATIVAGATMSACSSNKTLQKELSYGKTKKTRSVISKE